MPVGLTSTDVMLTGPLALVVVAAYARFAQVVKTCPYDITNNIWIFLHQRPVLEGIAGKALRLPHHALGGTLMVAGVLVDHVVIAADIEHIEVRVVDFPVTVPRAESFGDGTRVVHLQNGLLQLASSGDDADVLTLNHLIADAPADNARVVAVAQHHRVDVLAVARVYQRGVVVRILS